MRIRRGTLFFAVFAIAVSLGCVRLGFWQISRLRERQARNALILSRLQQPPVPVTAFAGDTGIRFRRAWAAGRYDFANEVVLATRSRSGSPGVHIITPLVLGGDTAVLVNRGWVYSPDGMHVDLARWREADTAMVEGFVEEYAAPTPGPVTTPSVANAYRRLDLDSLRARLPYTLVPAVLVQQRDSALAAAGKVPARVDPPPLSEGPHRAYAVQWFAFALVGVAGTGVVVARDLRHRRQGIQDGHSARLG